LICS